MSEIRIADAARNNAAWCDAVYRAHGRPGEFHASHWLARGRAPPYYPNLVTLDASLETAMAAVRELERARPSPAWAVKDSFGVLPLDREGFRPLLDGEWIARPALGRTSARREEARWTRVRSDSMLAAWEAAWGESAGRARIFLPPLLRESEIAVLAALDGEGDVVAGVIANRTEAAVGLSNFFARERRDALRAECLDAAMGEFPGLPLVGYESGRDLAEVLALGFRALGSLRVWLRDE
jgi:hypothetical protein